MDGLIDDLGSKELETPLDDVIDMIHAMSDIYNPDRYQKEAARTINPVAASSNLKMVQHGILGMTGELGELASALEKHEHYGQELDTVNIKEELGDVLWYVAEICTGLSVDLSSVMSANIEKLKLRFPEKFDPEKAKEENRNREAEKATIENSQSEFVTTGEDEVQPTRTHPGDQEQEPEICPHIYSLQSGICSRCGKSEKQVELEINMKSVNPCLHQMSHKLNKCTKCGDILEAGKAVTEFEGDVLNQTGQGFEEPPEDDS